MLPSVRGLVQASRSVRLLLEPLISSLQDDARSRLSASAGSFCLPIVADLVPDSRTRLLTKRGLCAGLICKIGQRHDHLIYPKRKIEIVDRGGRRGMLVLRTWYLSRARFRDNRSSLVFPLPLSQT